MNAKFVAWTCLLSIWFFSGPTPGQDRSPTQFEEAQDYFKRWLTQDVVYIISGDERQVFENLTTTEEKEQFVEQFWFRRDPDPTTPGNEFQEEHYRRIAYANDHFTSGIPGWRTDRGRIYIIHGEPAEIEAHPNVGNYERTLEEGGGSTTAFPFEIWRYRNMEGLGSDIVIEFVDPTMSGEYRLALRPEEKDALLYMPGAGLTLAEQLGLSGRADRPFFKPGSSDKFPYSNRTWSENPFHRYENLAKIQAPTSFKYRDLKQLVEVNVDYDALPFATHVAYFRLNKTQFLVPVTVQVENQKLMFALESENHLARLAVYGIVTSLTNRVVTEFEDDLAVSYRPEEFESGLQLSSIYQRTLILDHKLRYKLDLVVKDLNSSQVGIVRQAIAPPPIEAGTLAASPLMLSNYIRVLDMDTVPGNEEMFILGDVKIHPNLTGIFTNDLPVGVYLHLYNVAVDGATLAPSLEVTYTVLKKGKIVRRTVDATGQSVQHSSESRTVLIGLLNLEGHEPGSYIIQVDVRDRLSQQQLSTQEQFELVEVKKEALKH